MGEREMAMASFGLAWQAVRTDEMRRGVSLRLDRSDFRAIDCRSKWAARACGRVLSAAGRAVRPAAHVPEFGLSDLGRFLVGFCAPAPRKYLPEL